MQQQTIPTRSLELVTAVLLGIISLVTALLAWQGAAWTMRSDAFERDASNARDVSVTQSVLAEYARATDAKASAAARLAFEDYLAEPDPAVQLTLSTRVQSELGRATPTFSDAWFAWAGEGFPEDALALDDETYRVYRDGTAQSYAYVSSVAASLDDSFKQKALMLSQASLVNALALFLVGISGVNRGAGPRVAVLTLGVAVFLAALALAAAAF